MTLSKDEKNRVLLTQYVLPIVREHLGTSVSIYARVDKKTNTGLKIVLGKENKMCPHVMRIDNQNRILIPSDIMKLTEFKRFNGEHTEMRVRYIINDKRKLIILRFVE